MTLTISLNSEQRAAVERPPGPLLVVAGAGSGKTRVLTARIAWLLEHGARPESILAFTFTNRAAREMRERIEREVGDEAHALWVGTFHATAVRILRREGRALSIPRDFAIYDREDQEGVIREVIRRLDLAEDQFRPGLVLAKISDAKNALVTPEEMARLAMGPQARAVAECYALYQQELRRNAALDFDDLIAEAVRLFRAEPEVASRYVDRFRHVLVDEYQDTNHAQFRLVQALSGTGGDLFAVGDDDQSIYSFRGANPSHVLDFERAFPGAGVLRLEQNYRSTRNILAAANAVIACNRARAGKNLWCDREEGALITLLLAEDEVEEARRVHGFLAERVRRGGSLADCAVLYRTNAQSRALETELRKHLVPYEIVGGVSFYQRREVKDLLAYLRLALNPADAVAFWRVWNTPRRGLGSGARALVEERMARDGTSPLDSLRSFVDSEGLTRAARSGAASFLSLIDELRDHLDAPVDALVTRLLDRTQYLEYLAGDEDVAERRANVEELANAAAGFAADRSGTLSDFLAEAALVSDLDRVGAASDRVLLLTAHNAKGLEFPVVIVTGLEEGLFPHASSSESPEGLEEERRLFYVALTRARDQVLLTAAAYRRRADGARGGAVSRFVGEIPGELLDYRDERLRERAEARGPRYGTSGGAHARAWHRGRDEGGGVETAFVRHRALGREVFHESFGRGVVVEAEDDGGDTKFTVRFGTRIRKVLGRYLVGGSDGD